MKHTLPIILAALPLFGTAHAQTAAAPANRTIAIDAAAKRHPISPLVYGVCWATQAQLTALNAPLNRAGGNAMTAYNWKLNASNHANDWYFESLAEGPAVPGKSVDDFIATSRAGGAMPMVTVPMMGWVATLGPDRAMIPAFSVAKYGPQEKTDPDHHDAGNGRTPDGKGDITGNDPHDSAIPADPAFQKAWVQHLTAKWGLAAKGGVRYYLMDNEPALWNSTHRALHPKPETMDEERDDVLAYGAMVKSVDPKALVCAPEEWGWPAYMSSAADSAYAAAHNWQGHPDKDAHGGMDYIPWLLDQMRQDQKRTGKRLLDVCTVHIYPQFPDADNAVSPTVAAMRARSTRAFWDPNYKDESWIHDNIMLIPRLHKWVDTYYPGTKIGITEYNWGAEKTISGATAQAEILGILGRENVDLATRWTTPDASTPTFKAMQLYRNYDGKRSTFGDLSVSDSAPDPDTLSSFAALRRADGALTVMVIDKAIDGGGPVSLSLSHFRAASKAQAWQLTSANALTRLPDVPLTGGQINTTVPAQSVTLFVIPKG